MFLSLKRLYIMARNYATARRIGASRLDAIADTRELVWLWREDDAAGAHAQYLEDTCEQHGLFCCTRCFDVRVQS